MKFLVLFIMLSHLWGFSVKIPNRIKILAVEPYNNLLKTDNSDMFTERIIIDGKKKDNSSDASQKLVTTPIKPRPQLTFSRSILLDM